MIKSITKYVEYRDDNGVWKPLLWYSKRNDNAFESDKEGDVYVEHKEIFQHTFNEFYRLINETNLYNRGIPDDVSDVIKTSIESNDVYVNRISYYYLNELLDVINKEAKIVAEYILNGIEVHLYDTLNILKNYVSDNIDYDTLDNTTEGKLYREYKMKVNTLDELKYIHSVITHMIYDVHGYIPDDKIRVIFYITKG